MNVKDISCQGDFPDIVCVTLLDGGCQIVDECDYVPEHTCIDTDVLIHALDFIADQGGTCPYDMFDFQPFGGCEVECGKHQISTCWYEYFKSKVVE